MSTSIPTDIKDLQLPSEALGDFDLLAEGIFRILSEQLRFIFPSVCMYDDRCNGLRIVKVNIPVGIRRLVKRVLHMDIEEMVFPLSEKENLLVQSYLYSKVFQVDSVGDLVIPYNKPSLIKAIHKTIPIKLVAVFPVVVSGETIGVFALGSRHQARLSDTEVYFLRNLSEQIGTYLRNTWMLKSALEHNQILKKREENLLELISIKKQFLGEMHDLLTGLSSEFALNQVARDNIQNTLNYLRSLFLVSDSVQQQHNMGSIESEERQSIK